MSATEIERLPGANRDVSKVIAALPGVAARATFRNDIIIRGGSPGENKFYLDGIEVPNINHFATQGSSGGPVGLLNVNFIREVEFYSGAFPANRANGLSSVLSFKQKDGNKDALITNFALGSSDAALTFDGPIGDKGDFIFSVRRSYLQFLFAALKLPMNANVALGIPVILSTAFGGREWQWQAQIRRVQAVVDRQSRTVNAIAEVLQPFESEISGRPPLTPGMFVRAEIPTPPIPNLVQLPASVLRSDNTVLVVGMG